MAKTFNSIMVGGIRPGQKAASGYASMASKVINRLGANKAAFATNGPVQRAGGTILRAQDAKKTLTRNFVAKKGKAGGGGKQG